MLSCERHRGWVHGSSWSMVRCRTQRHRSGTSATTQPDSPLDIVQPSLSDCPPNWPRGTTTGQKKLRVFLLWWLDRRISQWGGFLLWMQRYYWYMFASIIPVYWESVSLHIATCNWAGLGQRESIQPSADKCECVTDKIIHQTSIPVKLWLYHSHVKPLHNLVTFVTLCPQ